MFTPAGTLVIATLVKLVTNSPQQKLVIGGDITDISKLPYSAFLAISCVDKDERSDWTCGASILKKSVLLTAAHCLYPCAPTSDIIAAIGDTHRIKAYQYRTLQFLYHDHFDMTTFDADIGLVRLMDWLTMGPTITPVALATTTPNNVETWVAGWGRVNNVTAESSQRLKSVRQTVFSMEKCIQVLQDMPKGSICAGNTEGEGSAAPGDSGSALVIVDRHGQKHFTQVGIVSYSCPHLSETIIAYTDVAYHHHWITEKAKFGMPNFGKVKDGKHSIHKLTHHVVGISKIKDKTKSETPICHMIYNS